MSRFFVDKSYYFITVPTHDRQPVFDTVEKKTFVLARLQEAMTKFQVQRTTYSIMSNHYHFLGYFSQGEDIPKFLQYVNGGSSYRLNKLSGNNLGSIWDEYHVYIVESEVLLAKVRGYITGNPLKHHEVKSMADLMNYPFSNYKQLVTDFGQKDVDEWIQSVIALEEQDVYAELKEPDSRLPSPHKIRRAGKSI